MMKYGILEIDTMFIPGGNIFCRAPGDVIFTDQGHVSNSGHLDVNDCSLAVGPWFNCKLPEYAFSLPTGFDETIANARFQLYPNPNNGQFILAGNIPGNTLIFELIDVTGRIIYRQPFTNDSSKNTISQPIFLRDFIIGNCLIIMK